MDWEMFRLLPGASRIVFDTQNGPRLKYTAIDPAIDIFTCHCKKPDCQIRNLSPFREHIARLFRTVSACDVHGRFSQVSDCQHSWAAVIYSLQMAASLTDAFADTSYVDDTDSIVWCGSVARAEDLHSEIAAKYMAGLVSFNFLWSAYEGAVTVAANGRHPRDTTAIRGRRLLADAPDLLVKFKGADKLVRIAEYSCTRWPSGINQLEALKSQHALSGFSLAAELCRLFRNHIAHGNDRIPSAQGDWDSARGWGDDNFAVYRFYTTGRLLLLLIQALSVLALREPEAPLPFLETRSAEQRSANDVLLGVHLIDGCDSASIGQ